MDTELAEILAECRESHARLLDTVATLPPDAVGQPCRLPEWTVGHLLTHIARNADSGVRMLEGARQGHVLDQYPGGLEGRAADIEAGAGRALDVLADDVRQSAARLEAIWEDMEPSAWEEECAPLAGKMPARNLPFLRWREVEVHHTDLGRGYGPGNWPEAYVARELVRQLDRLPGRLADASDRRAVVAWLLDRETLPTDLTLKGWQAP